MNGVNLGCWLVLEPWMIPSVFEGMNAEDEYTFMQIPGAAARLKKHRDTFITEEDWQWLSNNKIKFVRLPIGYWALKDDGPFKSTRKHLDWAFKMAEKYNIQILLDLHAMKGSQNGEMHSGVKGKVDWWRYRYETLDVLKSLAERYRDSPVLWGIEIGNEPKVVGHYFQLLWYYRKAYKILRSIMRPGTKTVFHDAFVAPLFSGALWPRKGYPVVMDSHFYLILEKQLLKLNPAQYDKVRGIIYRSFIAFSSWMQPVIIGEWSSVIPQAMFKREPEERHLQMLGDTVKRQRKMYKKAIATIYWNYKTEGHGMYNYRSLVEDGVVEP